MHAIAEAAEFGVFDAVALFENFVPQIDEGPHFAHLGDEPDACVDEEADPTAEGGEVFRRNAGFEFVEYGDGRCQSEGEFLFRRRACLLQVVGTRVHRVPFRDVGVAILGHVPDHLERRFRRADIRAARQIFLDQIVLDGALQLRHIRALFFGHGDVERQEPWGGRVDCHRRVHLFERDLVKQGAHVAQMRNRDADFANLAARKHMIAVISGLRG